MESHLCRERLPQKLALLIERDIRAGTWERHLPGHRTLMKRYLTSARTCIGALQVLESRGSIGPARQGKRRVIRLSPAAEPSSSQTLLIIRGDGAVSRSEEIERQAYRLAWENEGGQSHVISLDFSRFKHPEEVLKGAIERYSPRALLLSVATTEWVQAAVRLLPTFLVGGAWRAATNLSGLGFKIGTVVESAVRKLHELGHERILIPVEPMGIEITVAVRQSLAEGLGEAASRVDIEALTPIFAEPISAVWKSYWERHFRINDPTAVIVGKDLHVHSLYGYCRRRGISIPRDLSLVCLEHTDQIEWTDPVPSRFGYPTGMVAKHLRRWRQRGCVPLGMKFFDLQWIEGETTARCPLSRNR
ncbi:substrate-binding domain-containing protein [Luteolibacter marinus]|uniref:substrate-binding domain-containing protein n=1 Tax=Luteolibacter marinus TaxID=2776705 RepID=UPI0018693A3D|nr:substrate-binding domain-containing protein [Luteolibacter marinus]